MGEDPARTPRYVWAIILLLALLQPLVHFLTLYNAPEDTVPTGLHIPDSALFIHAMDMFPSKFHSAYATCRSGAGEASITYYSVPHLWLYGVIGLIARALPLDPFLVYGLANGLGALFYLWVVFRLLLVITPKHATAAFVLFALSGGPGGLLYLLSNLGCFRAHPDFEAYFFRFGVYDLMEGPHFNPSLYFPRLYYTLSLACCLGGLGALIQRVHAGNTKLPWGWMAAILVGSVLDARYTVFTFGLLVLYLACHGHLGGATGRRALLAWGAAGGAGGLLAGALMRLNPAVIENHLTVGNMAMWFSPFVLVTWLHWIAGKSVIVRHGRTAPTPARLLIFAACGYLAAYALGYVVYQAYFGNLIAGRDGSVAAAISDWALLGAAMGAGWTYFAHPRHGGSDAPGTDRSLYWIILWLLGYTALSLSGFGQGWFLKFGPQRLQVFIWLPLCIVAATGLAAQPRWRGRVIWGMLLACGVTSVSVAVFAFQSPLGRVGARGPYATLHPEIVCMADVALMAHLGKGTVLAPVPASDVVVRMQGNPVVYGVGSFNLTDQPHGALKAAVDEFFDAGTSDDTRYAIAERWCVAWVYCPLTWPVDAAVLAQLRAARWLEAVAEDGAGLVLKVRATQGNDTPG